MSVDVGSKAPDFTLPDQDRQPVTLSAQRGCPVVLAFSHRVQLGLHRELCTFATNWRDSTCPGYTVSARFFAGRSTPTDVSAVERLQQTGDSRLRCIQRDMIGLKGIAKRAVFVIDKDGIVRYREVLDDARNEPDYQRVFDALA
jgi:peroxiredoxin